MGPTASKSSTATFVDADLEEAFQRDGFVIVDFAPPEVAESLLDAYRRLDSGITSGYYPSLMSPDEDYKTRTNRAVTDTLWPYLGKFLEGYEPFLGVFMVKHPGDDTEVPPHQDWIVADESERPTMNVWFPLTPVTAESGIMRVLPGSHRWLEGLRGSPTFPTQWEAEYERVRDELMVEVVVEPGQGMIYDIRILHGTPPNRSQEARVVTSLYATPVGTKKVHYYRDPESGTVTGHEVPFDFCTTFRIGDVPKGPKFTEIVDYSVPPLTFEEMAERYRSERASVGAA